MAPTVSTAGSAVLGFFGGEGNSRREKAHCRQEKQACKQFARCRSFFVAREKNGGSLSARFGLYRRIPLTIPSAIPATSDSKDFLAEATCD